MKHQRNLMVRRLMAAFLVVAMLAGDVCSPLQTAFAAGAAETEISDISAGSGSAADTKQEEALPDAVADETASDGTGTADTQSSETQTTQTQSSETQAEETSAPTETTAPETSTAPATENTGGGV